MVIFSESFIFLRKSHSKSEFKKSIVLQGLVWNTSIRASFLNDYLLSHSVSEITLIESSSWPTILIVERSSLSVMDVPAETQAFSVLERFFRKCATRKSAIE
ncbi:30372_t:CDS:2, partial [Gigaspora margarita]